MLAMNAAITCRIALPRSAALLWCVAGWLSTVASVTARDGVAIGGRFSFSPVATILGMVPRSTSTSESFPVMMMIV
uniref:Putative secreted protein n=1 Tax=Anopheles darlingi TaxID=43151 RepID=A0A2M4DJ49_ANODA